MSKKNPTKMSLFQLANEFRNLNASRVFLYLFNPIPQTKNCPSCNNSMTVDYSRRKELGDFRCQKLKLHEDNKAVKLPVAQNTWFENSKIPLAKCMILTYCFSYKFTYEEAIIECGLSEDDTVVSSATVVDWYSYCREICTLALDRNYDEDGLISGDGHCVEVDEMKLRRRKFHRGRIVEGNWIFGLIDRHTKEYRLEICPDNKRDEETLLQLINKHVEKGSQINSDGWGGYVNLDKHGHIHDTVKSIKMIFVAADGTHTNTIESHWRPLRRRLAREGAHSDKLADHLCEFLWLRDQARFNLDPFVSLLNKMSKFYSN